MEDLTGKQFGHYHIVAPLGEGGMAAVYKAYQPSMERYVAVKVLPRHMATTDEFVNRFRREAKLLAQLQHPNILPVFDYGESEGYPYIVMPFVPSGTLAELLKNQRLPFSKVRRIIMQIGDALAYAHARGMIHRDIKPSNVLMDESGNCLLTDFCLARMVESSSKLTSTGTLMGTPAYMSPEQGAGSEIDHRSDIYSLGIILYEMVTGRVPYNAETPIAIVFKHIQDPLPSARKLNPELPESVELVLLKALAKSPEDRYQSMGDFLQATLKAIPETDVADKTVLQRPAPAASIEETLVAEAQTSLPTPTVSPQASARRIESGVGTAGSAKPRRFPMWALAGVGALALAAIAIVLVLGMANRGARPTTAATSAVTNTTAPINTPVPPPTFVPPIEFLPGESFRDDFDGRLAEGWSWTAEDPAKWSLSEVSGALQIMASNASFDGAGLPANVLLREAPSGDFEITTSLHFAPSSNFQFAGLVVFQGQGNALQFGRAFCGFANTCVGDGIYFDNFENGSIAGDNYQTPFRGSHVYLRLTRVGNTYTGYYSGDGQNWKMTGEHVRDFPQARVGLMAAQAPTEIPAVFDYFTMDAPSAVTARTELDCRASPDAGSDISVKFAPGRSMTVSGTSLDNHWLYVQNPENAGASCWIPFDANGPSMDAINTGYECTDPLGCVQIGPSDPFHIAFWGVLTGDNAPLGQDTLRGVEIAIDDLGGRFHDHDILLTTQDALCTTQGGAAAARHITSDETILALIGSICSNETIGGIEMLTNAGLTTVSPANTRPDLTDPNRGPGYAGFLRTAQNDSHQGRAVAEFIYNDLGIRRVAIIHDETSYSNGLQRVFADNFMQLGGQIVALEAVTSNDTDMRGVLTRIAGNSPELIYYPVFIQAGGHITKQAKEIPGLENVRLMASDTLFTPEFLRLAGPAATGMYISSPDFSQFPAGYDTFVEKYQTRYGNPPASSYHAHAYDATNMIFGALDQVGIVTSDGTIFIPRQALRNAIFATRDFRGITGTLTCLPTGDCGASWTAIYEVVNADPAAWNPQDAASPNPKKVHP